jgi:NADPH:quinone reductase-like Zn-dependent oxidoreductase
VTDLRPGDPVFGVTNPSFEGAYAEAASAQASMLARKPASISDLQAASVPVIAVTAMQMLLERARAAPGQRVLILGGAGNVGAYAVQLARDAGARVTALVRAADVAVVRQLGAEETMTSLDSPPPGGAFDVVIDTVGGDPARSSVRWLVRGGHLVSAVSGLDVVSLDRPDVRAEFLLVEVTRARLEWVAERLLREKLVVRVGEVLPLADAVKAHRMLEGQLSHAPGKIVLQVEPSAG